MRMFMMQLRAENRELSDDGTTTARRIYRAVLRSGVIINPSDNVEDWVRRLSQEYIIERTVSIYARRDASGRPLTREHANRLWTIAQQSTMPDVDSDDDSQSSEGTNEEG